MRYTVEVNEDGIFWYKENTKELHRENGPAIECGDGNKEWYLNDQLHREDGPAIECANGNKQWCINGFLHREDGPAFEGSNGDKVWYLNNKRHREDGPAIEYSDGSKEWWINNKQTTEREVRKYTAKMDQQLKNIVINAGSYTKNKPPKKKSVYKLIKKLTGIK